MLKKFLIDLRRFNLVLDQEVFVNVSLGVASYPGCGKVSEGLLSAAATALSHAKSQKQSAYQFFSKQMETQSKYRIRLENDLRQAQQREELSLFYQPQVDAQTEEIIGMEALLRWKHQELGMVSPGQFIPLAEEIGLITALGQWVLHAACLQNQKWLHDLPFSVTMAVNVSFRQLRSENFFSLIQNVLSQSMLDPQTLEIELTESTLMENPDAVISVLEKIHQLGIRIAIDDFGTGYSSLNYLRRLPIDIIKIDQSFVRDIGRDNNDESIVKTIISMAHTLGLKVIAEGVETKEQSDFLKEHKCDILQGYYFSRPLPIEEATQLLARGQK